MIKCDKSTEKTAANIWHQLKLAVASFGITPQHLRVMKAVSDEGANVISALKTYNGKNVICICHLLNTICKRMITPYKSTEINIQLDEGENVLLKMALDLIRNAKNVCALR
jgi:hypothetical protein